MAFLHDHKKLGNSEYIQNVPLMVEVNNLVLKAILKYRNHPSILIIKRKSKNKTVFTFFQITLEEILKQISNKLSQDRHVPTKIIRGISGRFICERFNNMIDLSIFPNFSRISM